jgi:hypothetical protein
VAALSAIGNILALAQRALADGAVTVGRHHADHARLVVIKLRAKVAHRLAEKVLVGVAQLIEPLTGLGLPLAAIEREPFGTRLENFVAMRHRVHPVRRLEPGFIAQAESHGPHHRLVTRRREPEIDLANWEVGPDDGVDPGQRDRFHGRHHFADFPRQIPADSKALEEAIHGVEGAALVEAPDIHRLDFASDGRAGRQANLARQTNAICERDGVGSSGDPAADLLPFLLQLVAAGFGDVLRPGFNRLIVRVVADEHEPVVSRDDAISAGAQIARINLKTVRQRTATDADFDGQIRPRLIDDGKLRAGNLLDVGLQFVSCEPGGSWRILRDDNLRARLPVLDKEGLRRSCAQ